MLLDEHRYEEWLALMTSNVEYRMPVRVTASGGAANTFLEGMDHFFEDIYSLRKRVERLRTEHAWTEDPPSRVRHFVTNVRTYDVEHNDDELLVRSYLLLFRSRGDLREAELVSAERSDILHHETGGWRLARRHLTVDRSVLRTQNLAIFL
jgi:phthalate 3,4-dioxygenase subunit beta